MSITLSRAGLGAGRAPGVASRPAAPTPTPLQNAIRKARVRLVPFLILMYMLAFLDRANVGMAKQALAGAIGLSPAAFALGAGIFFIGYALCEVPSNLILHRVGARRWMARIMVTWGLVAACTMFVQGGTSFVALRFVLGIAEAGFFPGVILYLTYWFPPEERGRVIGRFYFGYALALVLGTPLSGLLLGMDRIGGLAGWQWMFLIEGLMASAVGVVTLFVLPDRPADVAWLDDEEKLALSTVLARETRQKEAEGASSFLHALRDPWLLLFTTIYFLMQIGSYGVAFYLPDQVSQLLGVAIGLKVSLVSALPWLCAVFFTAFWPPLASRVNRPRAFFIVTLLFISGGILVSAHAPPQAAIVMLCIAAAGIISAQAIFWTFPTDRFGGTAAAGSIAVINSLGNLGGFVAPNLRAAADRIFLSPTAGLHALSIAALLGIGLAMLLPARGRRVIAAADLAPADDAPADARPLPVGPRIATP
ncbi:sugar phosphate permease [Gluconacetobacter johannae DSM 13595]|uniref:MFS transporter n=1 Tax=Gluconacetobacter johannae TaxID=112140 RepID=A0A7W4P4F6_9PROT|nr:MFS transporter [Gluconacetobacter johannae]MBB2177191.1 MFS transporter [Gluconacetobacter johannae]GBQ82135.1 sugar phosphate permease [Gluconacetobacter johannae DSM 13595]